MTVYQVIQGKFGSADQNVFAISSNKNDVCRFDHPRFFSECSRVLKSGGSFAAWGYGYPKCAYNQQVSDLITSFGDSKSKMGPYWAPERRHIDEEYTNIKLPDNNFHNIIRLKKVSPCSWTVDALVSHCFISLEDRQLEWILQRHCNLLCPYGFCMRAMRSIVDLHAIIL